MILKVVGNAKGSSIKAEKKIRTPHGQNGNGIINVARYLRLNQKYTDIGRVIIEKDIKFC